MAKTFKTLSEAGECDPKEIAELLFDEIVSIHGHNKLSEKIRLKYRSAAKYFLRWFLKEEKVKRYAPRTSQMRRIDQVIESLDSEAQKDILIALCEMERLRCRQAIKDVADELSVDPKAVRMIGSTIKNGGWSADLDIVAIKIKKEEAFRFRNQLENVLGKKVDITFSVH
jgi:predicted nucleotidyltransferase